MSGKKPGTKSSTATSLQSYVVGDGSPFDILLQRHIHFEQSSKEDIASLKADFMDLSSKFNDLSSVTNKYRQKIENLENLLSSKEIKIQTLENTVQSLGNELAQSSKELHFLNSAANRLKIRIYAFPDTDRPFLELRTATYEFLKSINIDTSTIVDFQTFNAPKGRQLIITFANVEIVEFICRRSKDIFNQYKIRISREMGKRQRSEMQKSIESAKVGIPNPKIVVDWASPAAYVNGTRVWPQRKSKPPPRSSYTSTSSTTDPSDHRYYQINLEPLHKTVPGFSGNEAADLNADGWTTINRKKQKNRLSQSPTAPVTRSSVDNDDKSEPSTFNGSVKSDCSNEISPLPEFLELFEKLNKKISTQHAEALLEFQRMAFGSKSCADADG